MAITTSSLVTKKGVGAAWCNSTDGNSKDGTVDDGPACALKADASGCTLESGACKYTPPLRGGPFTLCFAQFMTATAASALAIYCQTGRAPSSMTVEAAALWKIAVPYAAVRVPPQLPTERHAAGMPSHPTGA